MKQNVYFLGIGGIGMSALARYFLQSGCKVAGYDRTASPLTSTLEHEGAQIHYTDDVSLIPADFRSETNTLVVYTPAIPASHSERLWFEAKGFEMQKRSQVLGSLTRSLRGLCVAGTHGKTTTSCMAAHLLHESRVGTNAFLGGITKNYGTNYLINTASPYVVIEADEFDRSFHTLTPYATVITATDSDHLDIYGTREAYLESFNHYTSLVQKGGYLIAHTGIDLSPRLAEDVTLLTYGRDEGNFHADNIRIGGGEILFDFISPFGNICDVQLGVPVSINIDNGIAAMALAQIAGAKPDEIRTAMATFGGVDRRFDFKIKTSELVFLSDYGHHPEEVRQSISSIRQLYPDRRLTVMFQPHLYSRTKDFYKEFAAALNQADEVILLQLYPAREQPIVGVSSQLIFDCLRSDQPHILIDKSEVISTISHKTFDVLVSLGAGDLDELTPQITDILKSCI